MNMRSILRFIFCVVLLFSQINFVKAAKDPIVYTELYLEHYSKNIRSGILPTTFEFEYKAPLKPSAFDCSVPAMWSHEGSFSGGKTIMFNKRYGFFWENPGCWNNRIYYSIRELYDNHSWLDIWRNDFAGDLYEVYGKTFTLKTPAKYDEFGTKLWDGSINYDLTKRISEDVTAIKKYFQDNAKFAKILKKRGISIEDVKKTDFNFVGICKKDKRRVYRCNKVFNGHGIDLYVDRDLDKTGNVNSYVTALSDLEKAELATDLKVKAFYDGLDQIKVKMDKYFSKYSGIKFKDKPSDRVSKVVDHFSELSKSLKLNGDDTAAQCFSSFADELVRWDLGALPEIMEVATKFNAIRGDLAKGWKTPSAKLSEAMQDLELDAWSAIEGVNERVYRLSQTLRVDAARRDLFERIYATQVAVINKDLINSVAGKSSENAVVNTLRIITYQGLMAIDINEALSLNDEVMLKSIYTIAQTAKKIGEIVRDEHKSVQDIVGVSDKVKRTIAPLSIVFDETAQMLDLTLGYDENYEKVIVGFAIKDCQKQLHDEGYARTVISIAENLESELPTPGIILDPITDPSKPLIPKIIASEIVGVADIKTYTALTSRVNESLRKLAKDNQVVQAACNTNEKLNELAAQFALYDDLEDAIWLANTSRNASIGLLKYGAEVNQNKTKFLTNLVLSPLNFIWGLCSYGVEYSVFEDAFEVFDPVAIGHATKNILVCQKEKASDLRNLFTQVKKMTYEEFCQNGGRFGAEAFATYGAFKALGFGLGKAASLIENFEDFKKLIIIEKAVADANKVISPTQIYFKNITGAMKIALENGKDDLIRVLEVIKNNPELVEDFYGSMVLKTAGDPALVAGKPMGLEWTLENIPTGAIYKELVGIAPEVMPKQNLKHYFLGEIVKKGKDLSLQGFHHARSYPERIKEIIISPNKFGVYHAKYTYNGLEKESTFFPDAWDRLTVLKKINEAYKNPIKFDKDCGIIGKTSEGIEIRMWFTKDKATGNLTINSAYPTKDQLLKA